VQEVDFPAVTFCNPRGLDVGEYVRAIFNNFMFLEKKTTKKGSYRLKKMFTKFLDKATGGTRKGLGYFFIKWAG
jgi:hypothetical protein